jgi:hypothetical protein
LIPRTTKKARISVQPIEYIHRRRAGRSSVNRVPNPYPAAITPDHGITQ